MPYRRLPNTDAARLRAMENAIRQDDYADPYNRAFSLTLRQKMETLIPKFRTAISSSQLAREQQILGSRNFVMHAKKARTYLSHFIQVINMSITRGEMKASIRRFYGFSDDEGKVPSLATDQELLEWGEKVIKGDTERIAKGVGNQIYNPSIALVKVQYDRFKTDYAEQKRLQQMSAMRSANVVQYRKEADVLILELWDSIEAFFEEVPLIDERRKACEAYGISYVWRHGELLRMKQEEEAKRITMELPFEREKKE